VAGMSLLAVSPTWWSQASIGEVYTLHTAIITLGFAFLVGDEAKDTLLALYLFGLGLAHHPLTLPALLVAVAYMIARRRSVDIRHLLVLLLPLSLYGELLLRAKLDPTFDWGDPSAPGRLWWMMSGAQYHQNLLREGWQVALGAWAHALRATSVTQLGWIGTGLVLVGVVALLRTARAELLMLSLLFVGSCFVGCVYDIPDPSAYFLPAILALAVMAGVGFGHVWDACRHVPSARMRLAIQASYAGILAAAILLMGRTGSASAIEARDTGAFDYALLGTQVLDNNAVVLSRGDGRTFSLWYGSAVLRSRPDVAVVYESLLDWPWYREHLAAGYPDLLIPPKAPEVMRRYLFIAANLARHPVYVTEVPPDLARFDLAPAGPLFRVLGPATARASNEKTDRDPLPTPRK
jgi:hypothetical protein